MTPPGSIEPAFGYIGAGSLKHSWLADQGTALGSIIVTWIWRTIPFNMLILYANIMSLPTDYLEAAELDRGECVPENPICHSPISDPHIYYLDDPDDHQRFEGL